MVLLAFIVSITATARTNGKVGLAYPGPTTPIILQQSASAPLHAVCFASARMQQCTTKESTALLPIMTLVNGDARFTEAPRHGVVHLQHAATAADVAMGLPFLVDGLPPATLHSLHYYHRSNCGLAMSTSSVNSGLLGASPLSIQSLGARPFGVCFLGMCSSNVRVFGLHSFDLHSLDQSIASSTNFDACLRGDYLRSPATCLVAPCWAPPNASLLSRVSIVLAAALMPRHEGKPTTLLTTATNTRPCFSVASAPNRLGNSQPVTGLDSPLQPEPGLVGLGGAQLASALVDLGSSLPASAPSRSALEAISSSSLALALDADSVLDSLGGSLIGSAPDSLSSLLLGLAPSGPIASALDTNLQLAGLNNLQPASELSCLNGPLPALALADPGGSPPNSVFGTVSSLMPASALTRLLGDSLRWPGCLNSEIFITDHSKVKQLVFDNGGEFTSITVDQLFNVITTNMLPNLDNKATKLSLTGVKADARRHGEHYGIHALNKVLNVVRAYQYRPGAHCYSPLGTAPHGAGFPAPASATDSLGRQHNGLYGSPLASVFEGLLANITVADAVVANAIAIAAAIAVDATTVGDSTLTLLGTDAISMTAASGMASPSAREPPPSGCASSPSAAAPSPSAAAPSAAAITTATVVETAAADSTGADVVGTSAVDSAGTDAAAADAAAIDDTVVAATAVAASPVSDANSSASACAAPSDQHQPCHRWLKSLLAIALAIYTVVSWCMLGFVNRLGQPNSSPPPAIRRSLQVVLLLLLARSASAAPLGSATVDDTSWSLLDCLLASLVSANGLATVSHRVQAILDRFGSKGVGTLDAQASSEAGTAGTANRPLPKPKPKPAQPGLLRSVSPQSPVPQRTTRRLVPKQRSPPSPVLMDSGVLASSAVETMQAQIPGPIFNAEWEAAYKQRRTFADALVATVAARHSTATSSPPSTSQSSAARTIQSRWRRAIRRRPQLSTQGVELVVESTSQHESTGTIDNYASKQGGATALTDVTPVVPTRTPSKKGDAPELAHVMGRDASSLYLSERLAFLWHRRSLRTADSNSSPNPASRGYALQRREALALCQGWYEQVDEAEGIEAAGYTVSYPTWLAPAADAVNQSLPPRGPYRLSPVRCMDEPDGLGAAEAAVRRNPMEQAGPLQLSQSTLVAVPTGSLPPSPPCSPPELAATPDRVARNRARSSQVQFASELTAAITSLAAVRNGLVPLSAPQTKRTATHAAAGRARAAAGRMFAAVPIHIWAALDTAYRLRRRAAASPTAAARRAASARRERILAIRASSPQPIISFDVGSVDGELLYRSELGVISKLHPMSCKQGANDCIGHALLADGSTAPPLLPPDGCVVRLCADRSGAICYYDDGSGMVSWDPPPGSTRHGAIHLQSVQFLPGAAAPFTEPPPCFPPGLGLYSLRGTPWVPLFEDCESKVLMLHTETGCVRSAPWISLRTAYGCVFFVNLITHQTRWLPPRCWMQDWVSRPSINEDGRAYGMVLEGTRFTRDLLPPLVSRLRVEGGAPYLWESGLPTYASDEHDTRLTYPNG